MGPRTRHVLGRALGAWGAAALAWMAFLVVHVLVVGRMDLHDLATVILRAAAFSAAGAALLGGLHMGAGRNPRLAALLVATLALWPAWQQADFLTSGDKIAAHAQVAWIRAGIFAGAWLGLVALWLGHRAILAGRWRRPLLGVAALAALACFGLLAGRLDAYAFFGRFVTAVAWLVVATLAWSAPRPPVAGVVAAGLVGLALVVGGRVRAAPAVEWSHLWPPSAGSILPLDLSDPRPGECEARVVPAPAPLPAPERRKHVVIISIDALRKDGLREMPNLAAWMAGSLDFTEAHTTYPATLFAVGGAFTGWSPHQLYLAPEPPPSLFARVGERARLYLPRSKWFAMPALHAIVVQGALAAGFPGAGAQTAELMKDLPRLHADGRQHVIWVHYLEPHQPWEAPKKYVKGKGPRAEYEGELHYLDAQLVHLFRTLEASGWYDDSLILLFADHGEALGEHGYEGHHVYLNGWLTDVPLALRAPGVAAGTRTDLVELTDIAATVAHFLDLPPPEAGVGHSLLAPPPPDRFSVAEAFPLRGKQLFESSLKRVADLAGLRQRAAAALRARAYPPKSALTDARWRYIVNRTNGVEELYDRAADPGENHDLAEAEPEVRRALRAKLEAWYRARGRDIVCRVTGSAGRRSAP